VLAPNGVLNLRPITGVANPREPAVSRLQGAHPSLEKGHMAAVCWLAICLLIGAGCSYVPSHIHDDNKARIAQSAQSTMSDYVKAAPAMYSTMTSNAQLFATQEDATLANYSYLAAESLVHVYTLQSSKSDVEARMQCLYHFETQLRELFLPARSASDSRSFAIPPDCGAPTGPPPYEITNSSGQPATDSEIVKKGGRCRAFESYPPQLAQVRESLNALKPALSKALGANSSGNTISDLQKHVSDLKTRLTVWNEDIALLNTAVTQLPKSGSTTQSSQGILNILKNADTTLKNTKITYVDADGVKQSKSAADVIADTSKLNTSSSDPQSVLNAIPNAWNAPGIDLQIATLSLTLAQLEQKKTQRQLALYQQAQQVTNQARAELEVSGLLVATRSSSTPGNQKTILGDVIEATKMGGPCVKGLQKSPYPAQADALCASGYLQFMRNAMLAETIVARNYVTVPIKLARLNHQLSISESELDAQQYQALISSGLSGLVAYENGGLTSQEVGNVISFGQAVAVAALAGRVP